MQSARDLYSPPAWAGACAGGYALSLETLRGGVPLAQPVWYAFVQCGDSIRVRLESSAGRNRAHGCCKEQHGAQHP